MSNTDNQMTRFLFAILKQKNLKDIDWNAVAQDPILAQPITNGHAARMRYSRFRSSMLGLEPQRRNRNPNKSKSSNKTKKDQRPTTKKDEDRVKSEREAHERPMYSATRHTSPVNVKHEMASQSGYPSQFTPVSMASPAGLDGSLTSQLRLLTPCSDDMLSAPHNLQFSPQANMFGAFDMASASPCKHEHDEDHDMAHGNAAWNADNLDYSAFDAVFNNLDGYGLPGTCDHHHSPQQADDMMAGVSVVNSGMGSQVEIKSEPWESQYHR